MKPKETAQKGQRIYDEKLKDKLESVALDKYVAIDIKTEDYFVGETPEEALESAKTKNPKGIFYLVRVGHKGAFRLNSYISHETDWKF
jgi:uncharacterized membrane-anchored protein